MGLTSNHKSEAEQLLTVVRRGMYWDRHLLTVGLTRKQVSSGNISAIQNLSGIFYKKFYKLNFLLSQFLTLRWYCRSRDIAWCELICQVVTKKYSMTSNSRESVCRLASQSSECSDNPKALSCLTQCLADILS